MSQNNKIKYISTGNDKQLEAVSDYIGNEKKNRISKKVFFPK